MGLYNRDYGREQTPWERSQGGGNWGGGGGSPMGNWSAASMTTKLIVITAACWLASLVFGGRDGEWIFQLFGLHGYTLYQPWYWFQFITYGFLHSLEGPGHLFFNMLALYFFGRAVEMSRGGTELLRLYLTSMVVAGLIGSIYYVLQDASSVTVGASGAVACITIVFAIMYPNQTIYLFFVLPVPAWLFAVGFVLINLSMARNSWYGVDLNNTAFMVHLGGIAFGLLYHYGNLNLSFLQFDRLADLPRTMRDRARRTKLKVHDPDRKVRRTEHEADRVLAKLHEQGEASLTAAERRVLQRYSRDQRRKGRSEN